MSELLTNIKDLRAEARDQERNLALGETEGINVAPLWQEILDNCEKLTEDNFINLELLVYQLEALVRLRGFAGCKLGLQTLNNFLQLLTTEDVSQSSLSAKADNPAVVSLDEAFPGSSAIAPDDDIEAKDNNAKNKNDSLGIDNNKSLTDNNRQKLLLEQFAKQLRLLGGLNGYDKTGTLIWPLQCVAITEGEPPYQFWQYQLILDKQSNANIDFGETDLIAARDQSNNDFYQSLQTDIHDCQGLLAEISTHLDELFATQAPPLSQLKEAFETAYRNVIFFLENSKFTIIDFDAKETCQEVIELTQEETHATSNILNTRAEALRKISEVADYFAEHEPHSPLPYMLRRVSAWANLSFPELMQELISASESKSQINFLTGINLTEES